MFTLIIETSTEKGLAALGKRDKLLSYKHLEGGKELSRVLALAVDRLLEGRKPALIGVGQGPGSYTGTRVGTALAIGLKMGFQVPLVGFCSLEAFGPRPVLIDAKKGGFYALLGDETALLAPQDPSLSNLPRIGSPHPELIRKRLPETLCEERFPDPERLMRLVWDLRGQGLQLPPKNVQNPACTPLI